MFDCICNLYKDKDNLEKLYLVERFSFKSSMINSASLSFSTLSLRGKPELSF